MRLRLLSGVGLIAVTAVVCGCGSEPVKRPVITKADMAAKWPGADARAARRLGRR
jgi:hypothetical protein